MNTPDNKSPLHEETNVMKEDFQEEVKQCDLSSPKTTDDLIQQCDDVTSSPKNVDGSVLTKFDDLGLEEVSDTDAPQLSQCNSPSSGSHLENGELSNEDNADKFNLDVSDETSVITNNKNTGTKHPEKLFDNLEALETETISDNDELSLVDDDNIEEGEIPHEQQETEIINKADENNSRSAQPTVAAELSTSFSQEGEYEEGEIVEENVSLEIIEPVPEPAIIPPENKEEEIEANKENEIDFVDIERENEEKISKNLSLFRKSSRNILEHNYRDRSEEENNSFRHSRSRSRESEVEVEYKKKHKGKHKNTFIRNDDRKRTKKNESRHDNVKKSKKEDKRMGKDEYGRDVSLRRLNKSRNKREGSGRSRRRSRSFSRKSRKRKFSRSHSRSRKKKRSFRRRSYSSSSVSSSRSRTASPIHRSRGKKHKDYKKSKSDSRFKKHRGRSKHYNSENEGINQVVDVIEEKKSYYRENNSFNDVNVNTEKKKKSKSSSSLLSKEVYQTGGNIMVSVNFPCDTTGKSNSAHEGAKVDIPPPSGNNQSNWSHEEREGGGQHTPLQDEPMWSPRVEEGHSHKSHSEVVDDVILVTPPTPDPITISDSDEDHRTYRAQTSTASGRSQGPKTPPPPPSIRFAVMSKPSLKSSSNPMFHTVDEEDFQSHPPPPPTNEDLPPPPPPIWNNSPKNDATHQRGEPNSYDPFQPTKSASLSPSSSAAASPVNNTHNSFSNEEHLDKMYSEDSTSHQNDIMSPRKTGSASVHKQTTDSSIPVSTSLGSSISQITRQNTFYGMNTSPEKKNVHHHELSQTLNYAALTSSGNYVAEERRRSTSLSEATNTHAVSMETDSPLSPDSSEISDFFEPPSPSRSKQAQKEQGSLKSQSGRHKSSDHRKFDNLFNNAKSVKSMSAGVKNANNSKSSKQNKDKVDDDYIPRSAVDLQKVQRQERIAEEVKITLKPFFNKRVITKDQYKDIMRKSVMKVCQSKSGEINPAKIRQLVDAYIKRVRYHNKQKSTSNNNPPQFQTTLPTF